MCVKITLHHDDYYTIVILESQAKIMTQSLFHNDNYYVTSGRMYFEQARFQSRVVSGTSSLIGSFPDMMNRRDLHASN